jgi:DNA (cytosine-5)-methyltransferase 1
MTSSILTAIDLFSGCGGLTQGLKDAEFSVLAAVEIAPIPAETYKANHPEVKLFRSDIRTLTIDTLFEALVLSPGELDLLAGCPPCQGFSRIRNNNRSDRMDDPRNRLIDEVLRLISGLLPKVVMLENVPDLARYTRYLKFKRALRRLGYVISEAVLDVANFGVPQRRKRLVFLASRLGSILHPMPTDLRTTVRDAIGNLPPTHLSNDPLHNYAETRTERIRTLISAIPKDGGSRNSLSPRFTLRCHNKSDGFRDVYGRMRWDDVAPTITGGCVNPSKGRFLHPAEDRAITLREAALLQSFPSTYIFSLSRGKYVAAEMVGNALPPAFSKLQAEAIKSHIDQSTNSR